MRFGHAPEPHLAEKSKAGFMKTAKQNRRQFITAAGAGAVCAVTVARSALARPEMPAGFMNCAVVQMRTHFKTQSPLAPAETVRRMCHLIDECAQWGGRVDLVVFPNSENLTLTEGNPEIEVLNRKARALGAALAVKGSFVTKATDTTSAFVLIDPKNGAATHLKKHAAHLLKQRGDVPHSPPHDLIRYVQVPLSGMRSANKPMDSFAGLAG